MSDDLSTSHSVLSEPHNCLKHEKERRKNMKKTQERKRSVQCRTCKTHSCSLLVGRLKGSGGLRHAGKKLTEVLKIAT